MKNVKIKFIDKDNDNTIEIINAIDFIVFRIESEGNSTVDIELNLETATLLKNILTEIL